MILKLFLVMLFVCAVACIAAVYVERDLQRCKRLRHNGYARSVPVELFIPSVVVYLSLSAAVCCLIAG